MRPPLTGQIKSGAHAGKHYRLAGGMAGRGAWFVRLCDANTQRPLGTAYVAREHLHAHHVENSDVVML